MYYALDANGADIWERLEHPMLARDLCTELTQVYAVDAATCETDVLAVLNDMAASGLLDSR